MLQDENVTQGLQGVSQGAGGGLAPPPQDLQPPVPQEQAPQPQDPQEVAPPEYPEFDVVELPEYDFSTDENKTEYWETINRQRDETNQKLIDSGVIDDIPFQDRPITPEEREKDPVFDRYVENQMRLDYVNKEIQRRTTAKNPGDFWNPGYETYKGDEIADNKYLRILEATPFVGSDIKSKRSERHRRLFEKLHADFKNHTLTMSKTELQQYAILVSLAHNQQNAGVYGQVAEIVPGSVAWASEFAILTAATGGMGGSLRAAGAHVAKRIGLTVGRKFSSPAALGKFGVFTKGTNAYRASKATEEVLKHGTRSTLLSVPLAAMGHADANAQAILARKAHTAEIVDTHGRLSLIADETTPEDSYFQAYAKGFTSAVVEGISEGLGASLKYLSIPSGTVAKKAIAKTTQLAGKTGAALLPRAASKALAQANRYTLSKALAFAKKTGKAFNSHEIANFVRNKFLIGNLFEEAWEERLNELGGYWADRAITGMVGGMPTVDDYGVSQHLIPALVNKAMGVDQTGKQISASRQMLAELISFGILGSGPMLGSTVNGAGKLARSALTPSDINSLQLNGYRGLFGSKEDLLDTWSKKGNATGIAWQESETGSETRVAHATGSSVEIHGETKEGLKAAIEEIQALKEEVDANEGTPGKPSRSQIAKTPFMQRLTGKKEKGEEGASQSENIENAQQEGVLRQFGSQGYASEREQLTQKEISDISRLDASQRDMVWESTLAAQQVLEGTLQALENAEKFQNPKVQEAIEKAKQLELFEAEEAVEEGGVEAASGGAQAKVVPDTEMQEEQTYDYLDRLAREEVLEEMTGHAPEYTQEEGELRDKFKSKSKHADRLQAKRAEIEENWASNADVAGELEFAGEWVADSIMRGVQDTKTQPEAEVPEAVIREEEDVPLPTKVEAPVAPEVVEEAEAEAPVEVEEEAPKEFDIENTFSGDPIEVFDADTQSWVKGTFRKGVDDTRAIVAVDGKQIDVLKEEDEDWSQAIRVAPTKKAPVSKPKAEVKIEVDRAQGARTSIDLQPTMKNVEDIIRTNDAEVAEAALQHLKEHHPAKYKQMRKKFDAGKYTFTKGRGRHAVSVNFKKFAPIFRAFSRHVKLEHKNSTVGVMKEVIEEAKAASKAAAFPRFRSIREGVWRADFTETLPKPNRSYLEIFSMEEGDPLGKFKLLLPGGSAENHATVESVMSGVEKFLSEEGLFLKATPAAQDIAANLVEGDAVEIYDPESKSWVPGKFFHAHQARELVGLLFDSTKELISGPIAGDWYRPVKEQPVEQEVEESVPPPIEEDVQEEAVQEEAVQEEAVQEEQAKEAEAPPKFNLIETTTTVDRQAAQRVAQSELEDTRDYYIERGEIPAEDWEDYDMGNLFVPESEYSRDELVIKEQLEDVGIPYFIIAESGMPFAGMALMAHGIILSVQSPGRILQTGTHEIVHILRLAYKDFSPEAQVQLRKIEKKLRAKVSKSPLKRFLTGDETAVVTNYKLLFDIEKEGDRFYLENEVVAQYITGYFNTVNRGQVQKLLTGKDRNVWQKIYDAIVQFFRKMTGANIKIENEVIEKVFKVLQERDPVWYAPSQPIGTPPPMAPAAPLKRRRGKGRMPTQRGVLEKAVSEMQKSGEQAPVGTDRFFQTFWLDFIKAELKHRNKSGLLSRSLKNLDAFYKSYEIIFEDMFPTLITQHDRKNYAGYYDSDGKVAKRFLRKGLKEIYGKDYVLTDDHWIAFQIMAGVFSPQTMLEQNIEEALQMLHLYIERGSKTLDDFIWVASDDMGVPSLDQDTEQPMVVTGSSNGAKVRAAIVSLRLGEPQLHDKLNDLLDHPQVRPYMDPKDISAIKRAKGMNKVKKLLAARIGAKGEKKGFPYLKWALADLANTLVDRESFRPNVNSESKYFGQTLDSIGYKSPKQTDAKVVAVVKEATGQGKQIPVGMMFGPKVGAYVLNGLGHREFITTDIWEARLGRTFFKGMMKSTGVPTTTAETEFFQTWAKEFTKYANQRIKAIVEATESKDTFKFMDNFFIGPDGNLEPRQVTYTGKQIKDMLTDKEGNAIQYENADLQAVRWFFTINLLRRAGYAKATTDNTISGYLNDLIQEQARRIPPAFAPASPRRSRRPGAKSLFRGDDKIVRGYGEAALRRGRGGKTPEPLSEVMAINSAKHQEEFGPGPEFVGNIGQVTAEHRTRHRTLAGASSNTILVGPREGEDTGGSPEVFTRGLVGQNNPNFVSLEDWHRALAFNASQHPEGAQVYVGTPEEYKDHRLIFVVNEKGHAATAAVAPDGEMVGGSKTLGADLSLYVDVLNAAIAAGGTWANAFDTVLPEWYSVFGLTPVAKVKFNKEFAPDDWDYERAKRYHPEGTPDILFMVYDGNKAPLSGKVKPPGHADSYDAAADFAKFTLTFGDRLGDYYLGSTPRADVDAALSRRMEYFEGLVSSPVLSKHSKLRLEQGKVMSGYASYNPDYHRITMTPESRDMAGDAGLDSTFRHELVHAILASAGFYKDLNLLLAKKEFMKLYGKTEKEQKENMANILTTMQETYGEVQLPWEPVTPAVLELYSWEWARAITERFVYGEVSEIYNVFDEYDEDAVIKLLRTIDAFINDHILSEAANPEISDAFLQVAQMLQLVDPQAQKYRSVVTKAHDALQGRVEAMISDAIAGKKRLTMLAIQGAYRTMEEDLPESIEKLDIAGVQNKAWASRRLYTALLRGLQGHLRKNSVAELHPRAGLAAMKNYQRVLPKEFFEDWSIQTTYVYGTLGYAFSGLEEEDRATTPILAFAANLFADIQIGDRVAYANTSMYDPLVTLGQSHGGFVTSWAAATTANSPYNDKMFYRVRHFRDNPEKEILKLRENPDANYELIMVSETTLGSVVVDEVAKSPIASGLAVERVKIGEARMVRFSKHSPVDGPKKKKASYRSVGEYVKQIPDPPQAPAAPLKGHRLNRDGNLLLKNQQKLPSGEVISHEDVDAYINRKGIDTNQDSILKFDKLYDYNAMAPKKGYPFAAPPTPKWRWLKAMQLAWDGWFTKARIERKAKHISQVQKYLKLFRLHKEIPEKNMPGWFKWLTDWFAGHADDGIDYSVAQELFRELKLGQKNSISDAVKKITYVMGDLTDKEHETLSMYLVHANAWDEHKAGRGIHWYDTPAELEIAYGKLVDEVNASPKILAALKRRGDMVRRTLLRMHEVGILEEEHWLNYDKINPETGKKFYETWFHQEVINTTMRSDLLRSRVNLTEEGEEGEEVEAGKRKEDFDYITNYVAAEYAWLTNAEARANRAEGIQELNQHYGVLDELKQLAKDKFQDENKWYKIFDNEKIPGTDVRWNARYKHLNLKQALAQWLGAEYGDAEARQILTELLDQPQLKEAVEALEARLDGSMVLPAPIVDQLDHLHERAKTEAGKSAFVNNVRVATKQWLLQRPQGVVGYNLRNLGGDSDWTIAAQPGIFRYLGKALEVVFDDWADRNLPGWNGRSHEILELAHRWGVVDNSLLEHDMLTLDKVKEFKKYLTKVTKSQSTFFRLMKSPTVAYKKYMKAAGAIAYFRENVFRLAGLMYFRENAKNIATEVKGYTFGGTNANFAKQVYEHLGTDRFAAMMSRDHFGDYGNTTVATQYLSGMALPFFKYTELIARRYYNLIDNFIRELRKENWDTISGVQRGTLIAALFATKIYFWHAVLQGVSYLIMGDDDPDDYGAIDKESQGLKLGKDPAGNVTIMRNFTAAGDLMSYVGVTQWAMHFGSEGPSETGHSFLDLLKNKVYSSLYPNIKIGMEMFIDKSLAPDVTRPRDVRGGVMEMVANNYGLRDFYRELSGQLLGTGLSARPGSVEGYLTGKRGGDYGNWPKKIIGTVNTHWQNYWGVKELYEAKTGDTQGGKPSPRPDFSTMFYSGFHLDRKGFDTAWHAYRKHIANPGNYQTFQDQLDSKKVLPGSFEAKLNYLNSLTPGDQLDVREADNYLHDAKTRMQTWYLDNLQKHPQGREDGIKLRRDFVGTLAEGLSDTIDRDTKDSTKASMAQRMNKLRVEMGVSYDEAYEILDSHLRRRDPDTNRRRYSVAARTGIKRRFRQNWHKLEKTK